MPSVLLESLKADALVTVVEHAAVGAKLIAVVFFGTDDRDLTGALAAYRSGRQFYRNAVKDASVLDIERERDQQQLERQSTYEVLV